MIKQLLLPVILAAAVACSGIAYTPDRPTAGVDASFHPLGRPQASPGASTSYAFLDHNSDGSPVSYDPCRPIHYVTRAANQPGIGPEMVKDAIDAASQATGLMFINDGTTDEAASPKRPLYQPDRYGDRWAPVLIDWQVADENPVMTDRPDGTTLMGIGGSAAAGSVGAKSYVTGQLQLNAPALVRMAVTLGSTDRASGVIKHELGHLVGLGHVQDTGELMNAESTAEASTYQGGDLAGLAVLGQGKCRPEL